MAFLKRIDHVAVLVEDLDAAFDTYTTRLGFPVSWHRETHESSRNAALWLGNASLELLQPLSEGSGPLGAFFRQAMETRGPGLFMVAFEPDGIERTVDGLRQRGAGVGDPNPGTVEGAHPRSYLTAVVSRRSTPGLESFLCEYNPPFVPADGGAGPMKIKKLDHVVIATHDLEGALALWERNVGLKPDASLDHPLGAGFKVARLPIGESFLELVQPVDEEGRFYEQVQQRGEGLFSISVEVEDLDEAVAFLRGNGAKVSDPEPSIWPNARLARINQASTHGVSIQLIQRR